MAEPSKNLLNKAAVPNINQVDNDLSADSAELPTTSQAAKGNQCLPITGETNDMEVDDMDLGPDGKASTISPEEEEKLLTSPTRVSEGKDGNKVRLCGPARKRLKYFLSKGHSIDDARELAQKPADLKRQRSSSTTPKQSSPKRTNLKVSSSAEIKTVKTTETEGPKAAVPNPEVEVDLTKMSYKDAACSTKLGIIPPDYPTTIWSTEKLTAIQHVILEAIRKKQTGAIKPKFNSCTSRPGYIVLSCGCDDTANWLKEAVPTLKPWKDAQMKIVQEADIPRPQIFVGHFPELDSTSTEDIITLIDGQNEGLKTNDWRVLNRVRKGSVAEITISIDPISAEVINTHRNWLNYGFGKVQLRQKNKSPIDPPKDTEKDSEPSVKQGTVKAGFSVPTASIAQDDKASCSTHDADEPATSSKWRDKVAEGIRMRPPLRGDKKAHSHNKAPKGDQMSAEEAALLKSNRGKKRAAIAKKKVH